MLGRRHFRVCVCSIPASAIPAIPALFITQEDLSVVSITPRLTVLLPQSEAFAPAAQKWLSFDRGDEFRKSRCDFCVYTLQLLVHFCPRHLSETGAVVHL
jgi:hypothetical protein